ncbi:MAG: hypothetical protein HQL90_07480 [Magnetococcales bacterium]|nr:hypothetical protein [Magnetococcales bacterium]
MKKIVVEKIKKHLIGEGWMIEKIKKLDFWAFHADAPAFCVVQAGACLIFFCDMPLNASWEKRRSHFFELLNSINNSFSHGVRVIKLNDEHVDMLHASAVWHNYYNEKEFGQFFDQFVSSVVDLYHNDDIISNLKV